MAHNLISLLRISHKKKIEDLSSILKISVNKYLDLEAGKAKPNTSQALMLADIYYLEASVFLSEDKPMININAGSNNRMVINLFTNNYHETQDEKNDDLKPEEAAS